MKIHDIEQGSVDWYRLRLGIPTASAFAKVFTPKKQQLSETRHKLACRLVAERLMNWQADSLQELEHIKAGKEREPLAVRQLEFVHEVETRPVGFITSDDGRIGASPDRLVVGSLLPVEVKCPSDPIQLEYLLLDQDVYKCQRQGQLLICERDSAIFFSYHPRMPECFVRTDRDEPFIRKLRAALDQFCDELDELTERAKSLGVYQAYELATPAEAEHGAHIRSGPMPTGAEVEELLNTDNLDWAG